MRKPSISNSGNKAFVSSQDKVFCLRRDTSYDSLGVHFVMGYLGLRNNIVLGVWKGIRVKFDPNRKQKFIWPISTLGVCVGFNLSEFPVYLNRRNTHLSASHVWFLISKNNRCSNMTVVPLLYQYAFILIHDHWRCW